MDRTSQQIRAQSDRTLLTSRLVLEPLAGRHGELLFDLLQDASIYDFMPTEPPESRSRLRERYEFLAHRRSPDDKEIWLNWAVRLYGTHDYIGTVQATVREDATALLAYELAAKYRMRGYATEACRAVMDEVVTHYGVDEIGAYVDTRNERSIRLLVRLGFTRRSFVAGADYFKGASSDEYVYSWRVR